MTFAPLLRTLRSVDGVADVRRRYFREARVEFSYREYSYVVNEPWSDSSRYWIGPAEPSNCPLDSTPLEEAFVGRRTLLDRLGTKRASYQRCLPKRWSEP